MARDNYVGKISFKFLNDNFSELKEKYDDAIINQRGWISVANKRISMNFAHYVIKYFKQETKKDD